jgi:hypothetical protein
MQLGLSTVGANEEVVRKYVQNQEAEDKRAEQLNLCLQVTSNINPL